MKDEANTPSSEGIDNVALSEHDTPETWDYYDPDEEEQDTVEAQEEEGIEEGPVEGEEAQETEDQADEEPDEAEAEPELVALADGTKITLDELRKGYQRTSDYTRKTQEVATQRKALEADVQRLESITQAFIDHLASMVPAEPDPALALREPNKYTAQKAQYDAAVAQVQKLIEIGSKPKEITQAMSESDRSAMIREENRRLVERFPQTATQDGRTKFFTDSQTAAHELGFTTEELQGVTDHRMFAALHWAKIGMEAAKNREKAKAKVEKAPPATPRKPGQAAAKANRNAEAMRKLARSGSIRDALAVDWD